MKSFSVTGCCCRNASQREVPQCENIPPFIANTMASVCASLTNAYWAPTDPPTINANTTARKTARGAGIKDIDIPHAQPCLVVRLPLRGGRVFAPVRGKQRSRDPARTPPGLCPGTEPGRIHLGVSQATRPSEFLRPISRSPLRCRPAQAQVHVAMTASSLRRYGGRRNCCCECQVLT